MIQKITDSVFQECMKHDIRRRGDIVRIILSRLRDAGYGGALAIGAEPEIKRAISRTCTRAEAQGNEPEYYVSHTRPEVRYVSVARVRELARKAGTGTATPSERLALAAMMMDLASAAEHVTRVIERQAARRKHIEGLVNDGRVAGVPLPYEQLELIS